MKPFVEMLIVQTLVSSYSVALGDSTPCKCAPAVGERDNVAGFSHV